MQTVTRTEFVASGLVNRMAVVRRVAMNQDLSPAAALAPVGSAGRWMRRLLVLGWDAEARLFRNGVAA